MATIHWYGEYSMVRGYDIPFNTDFISKVKEGVEWDLKENLEPDYYFPDGFDWSEENLIRIFNSKGTSDNLPDYEYLVQENIDICIDYIVHNNWAAHSIDYIEDMYTDAYIKEN